VRGELEAREREIQELRERDAARQKELDDIKAMLSAGNQAAAPPKKRRGRPPKVKHGE